MSTSRSAIGLRRASRLQAPEPTCVMNRAAPGMETFFMMASWIWDIIGISDAPELMHHWSHLG